MDKKDDSNKPWTDQKLMFNHSETIGDSYDTLIKAIRQVIR
ncbi:MAG: hypothetical protein PHV07_09240 [Oscillospiraceae bacterium]|nr:hypothetical protein [Oscillospiraceae bacterium]